MVWKMQKMQISPTLLTFAFFDHFLIFLATLRGWVLDVWSGKCKNANFSNPFHFLIIFQSFVLSFFDHCFGLFGNFERMGAGRMVWKMQKMQISRTLFMFLSFLVIF